MKTIEVKKTKELGVGSLSIALCNRNIIYLSIWK